jgi:hypothetical protein
MGAFMLGVLFLVLQLGNAFFRKYPAGSSMPLVVSCSAAISANCHRPEPDKDAYLLPVRWGVVGVNDEGHKICSFTTMRDVEPPKPGDILMGTGILARKPRKWGRAFDIAPIKTLFDRFRRGDGSIKLERLKRA